jgi:hypothetical protein
MRDLQFAKYAAGAALAVAISAFGVSAQGKKPKPKPLATPPVLTGAEIISQAGDLQDPQTVTEQPVEPAKLPNNNAAKIRNLNERLSRLEQNKPTAYDERQRTVLLNLDILTRAEQRSEALRKQLFEMMEKETTIKTRLDQIEYDIRPENIERVTVQLGGSLRPEEVRDNRRRALDNERRNLQSLLIQIQTTRTSVESALLRADQLVDRLRQKLEKDIDDSLNTKEENPEQQPDQQ